MASTVPFRSTRRPLSRPIFLTPDLNVQNISDFLGFLEKDIPTFGGIDRGGVVLNLEKQSKSFRDVV